MSYFSSSSGHLGSYHRILEESEDAASAMFINMLVAKVIIRLLSIIIPPRMVLSITDTYTISSRSSAFNMVCITAIKLA